MTYKIGLLEIMLFRCFSIFFLYKNIRKNHEKIVKLEEICKQNSYPEKFIEKCIENFLTKFTHLR